MHALTARLRDQWGSATRADLALLLTFGILFWASKWAGKIIDGVPGHSGAFWVPVLLVGAGTLGRTGAGTMTAMLGAFFWCFPKGGGGAALAPYVAAGLTIDLLAQHRDRLRSLPVALAAGALAHLAKYAFHNLPRIVLGAPADFLSWSAANVAGLHLLFGLLGGLIAWLALQVLNGRTRGPGVKGAVKEINGVAVASRPSRP